MSELNFFIYYLLILLTTLFVKSSKIVLPSVATSCTHDAFKVPSLPQRFFSMNANT